MNPSPYIDSLERTHQRASNVAALMPAADYRSFRAEIYRLVAAGASFDEAKTTLLNNQKGETP